MSITEDLQDDSFSSHSFDVTPSFEASGFEFGSDHSTDHTYPDETTHSEDGYGYGPSGGDTADGSNGGSADTQDVTQPADGMYGDPSGAQSYWFEQAENGWCGPASVSEVIAQATGNSNLESIEHEVVNRAEQLGMLTHEGSDVSTGWSGMQPADIATLLQSFGVPATEGTGSISDLEHALANGDQVIAAVDSTTIWDAEGAENVTDPGLSDHALVVTGIDEKNGIVYLNDPGRPEGGGTHVSLDVFEKAWAASGNTVVVANASGAEDNSGVPAASDPAADYNYDYDTPGGTESQYDDYSGAATYILPVTLTTAHSV